jgi:beta-N-acetylhexosaminidase
MSHKVGSRFAEQARQTSQHLHNAIRFALCLVLCFSFSLSLPKSVVAQQPTPGLLPFADVADAVVEQMTPQQKVGQLFMVSFVGAEAGASSDIADLIRTYNIGGVQLKASNQNFSNDDAQTPQRIAQLVSELQTLAVGVDASNNEPVVAPPTPTQAARPIITATTESSITIKIDPRAIPLFIAMTQENEMGGSLELPELRVGMTQIPSQLALGATWKAQHAQTVGEIIGSELARMGVNTYFGPALDVVETPVPNSPGDLGTHVFGGDAFWVGKFSQAFVQGVKQGSAGKIAVVAKNFPGLGSSDRNVNDEIPTVQKSLAQLRQVELVPFFATTQRKTISDTVVDGFQVTHIRYRGFQGNTRASTRPVSLDPQAYQALFALPELKTWRDNGGVTFSDQLGVKSVRRFLDPSDTQFNPRTIAQSAFTAGNDVLVLGNYGQSGSSWQEQLAAIRDTISFFTTKYVDDPNFAAQVNESVKRIVALKLRLYDGNFKRAAKIDTDAVLQQFDPRVTAEKIAPIAKDGVTLLAPSVRDLPALLPAAPTANEHIVFITDDRLVQDCAKCKLQPVISRDALQNIAVSLYGPEKTQQVDPQKLSSFALDELMALNTLNASVITLTLTPTPFNAPTIQPAPTPEVTSTTLRLQNAISQANWIVFSLVDANPNMVSAQAFRDFLSSQADAIKDKKIIVFAFGAPYYLDATEVSKITAYYGVYSRIDAYLQAAVRALFQEIAPVGSSPVTVNSTGYVLSERTSPNSEQTIQIAYGEAITNTQATPTPLELKIGDKLQLRAGPILDRNGRIVPDGTQVQFVLQYPAENVSQPQAPVFTSDGFALITVPINRQGQLEIRVESDPAKNSDTLRLNVSDAGVRVERIVPTVIPTNSPIPPPTPSPIVTPTQSIEIAPPIAPPMTPLVRANMTGFLLTTLLLLGVAVATLLVLSGFRSVGNSDRLRGTMFTWIVGWAAYVLYAIGFPGTRGLATVLGWVGAPLCASVIALVAFGGVMIFTRLRRHIST